MAQIYFAFDKEILATTMAWDFSGQNARSNPHGEPLKDLKRSKNVWYQGAIQCTACELFEVIHRKAQATSQHLLRRSTGIVLSSNQVLQILVITSCLMPDVRLVTRMVADQSNKEFRVGGHRNVGLKVQHSTVRTEYTQDLNRLKRRGKKFGNSHIGNAFLGCTWSRKQVFHVAVPSAEKAVRA
ncbi:hypothetical protein ABW99_00395 [Pandoraea thiooxydans]|uniref:Uncharacterized protein n=1 Tax=Pandoraea thiooxydans TaxID=445709 RepID=A0A0G3ENQ3_9BURK|nr:hypothetical protein ABW99_00395 [Pandoraea thiooxydans]